MSKFPFVYAWDTGRMLDDRWADIRFARSERSVRDGDIYASEQPPDDQIYGWCEVGEDGLLVARYHREEVFGPAETTVKLWFLLVDGGHLNPPHLALLAYADGRFPWGTVLTEAQAKLRGIDTDYLRDSHVAMMSWRKGDPIAQRIYTHPDWRRKRIMVAVFGVADLVNACGGYSPGKLLYGGEITTEDGERIREAFEGSARIVPRIGSFEAGAGQS